MSTINKSKCLLKFTFKHLEKDHKKKKHKRKHRSSSSSSSGNKRKSKGLQSFPFLVRLISNLESNMPNETTLLRYISLAFTQNVPWHVKN